jgi:hypothetical protein
VRPERQENRDHHENETTFPLFSTLRNETARFIKKTLAHPPPDWYSDKAAQVEQTQRSRNGALAES